MTKVLIFGNSGSGKTTLAKNLAICGEIAHLELDTLAWLPTSPPLRRPIEESEATIAGFIKANKSWVVEGCYTDLLELLADAADEAVFLNLSIDQCIANALVRPFEAHKFSSPAAQELNQAPLIQWIKEYNDRNDECSYSAHREFFNKFTGSKKEINNRP
jgi:adenylate kinase family enzyme